MGVENGIFWSEIGSGFGEPGGTPLPRIPRCTRWAHNAVNFRSRAVLHALCSMDLFPTENLPWPQNVYFIQCNLSKKKKISGRKPKGFCRDIFSPIPVNVELTLQLKFDPALNTKFFRLCKFQSRLNFV